MSSSLQNEGLIPATGDRRLFSRKKLPHVVLVFFGRNGWGRLVNLSESGMAFEFSGLGDVGQVLTFELADLTQNSMHVDGRIIWTRDLDRIAGVEFVEPTPESKHQIRQWLSSGKFTQTRLHDEAQQQASQLKAAAETAPPVEIAPPTEIEPPAEIRPAAEIKPPEEIKPADLFKAVEAPKPVEELKPLEPPPKREKAPSRSEDRNPRGVSSLVPEPRPEKTPARSTVEQRPAPPPEQRTPQGVSSLVPQPRPEKTPARSTVVEQRPIPPSAERNPRAPANLVPQPRPEPKPEPVAQPDPSLEVWDDYFNRAHAGLDKPPVSWTRIAAAIFALAVFSVLSLLAGIWTARYRQSQAQQAQDASGPSSSISASASAAARPFEVEVEDAKNKQWLLTFAARSDKRAAPPAPRAAASGNSASPTAAVSHGQNVASKSAQDPPARTSTPAGPIEPAHLISSVPPAYPAVARSQNIGGDVVIDALIDSTGKVTDMNVVSGPILLRQSALESVRLSKYSPAHLDGRPVPTHRLVTVRFAKQ